MLGLKVNWYRNHAEKKKGVIKGTGELVKVTSFNTQEGVAIIVSEDGELEEIILSLVKVVKPVAVKPKPAVIKPKQEQSIK